MNIHVRYVHVVCPAIITSRQIYNFRPRYNTDIKKSTFLNVYVKLGTEQGMTRTYKPEICDVNILLVFKKKENQKFVLDDFPAVNTGGGGGEARTGRTQKEEEEEDEEEEEKLDKDVEEEGEKGKEGDSSNVQLV